jgi:Arc/MetJ family transcription regulator
MRTNIEINEKLLSKAKKFSDKKTKKAIVEEALEFYVRMHSQTKLLDLFGKVHWEGDLDEMRSS